LKLLVLWEVSVGDAPLADIVQCHEVMRQHIYRWCQQQDKGLWPDFKEALFHVSVALT